VDDWMHAADSHGIVSRAELGTAGLHARDIARMSRTGSLTVLARGWYAVGPVDSDVERHVMTARAALRSHEGRAVAGHHSGLLVLGLPTLDADLRVVRLSRRTPGPTNTTPRVRLGRAVPVHLQRAETVAPGLAVVQHGISAGPLAALVAADGALRLGLATRHDLDEALDGVRQFPHTAGMEELLRHADGRHQSPGETRLGHALRLLGIRATPQVRLTAGGVTAIVDFLVDDAPVVIEFDGRVKYGRAADEVDPFGRRRPAAQVLWEEKRREDWVRELGYEVVRVVSGDLDGPATLGSRIRRAVSRAGARHRTA
jgi:very-short-patch-repair endonuclease